MPQQEKPEPEAVEYIKVITDEYIMRVRDALRLSDDEMMEGQHPNLKDGVAMLQRASYQFQQFARSLTK